MVTVTVSGLSLQMDFENDENIKQKVKEAIDLINLTLQREPADLSAQIFDADTAQVEVKPLDYEFNGTEVGD